MPVAATLKVVDAPTQRVRGVGWTVIEGKTVIVSEAASDVMVPQLVVTTQSYDPADAVATGLMVKLTDVAPTMGTPSLRHWTCDEDETAMEKVVEAPTQADREVGWVVMPGGGRSVSVAEADVTLPHSLEMMQSYDPASAAVTEAMSYLDAVAPGMGTPPRRHWNVRESPVDMTRKKVDEPAHAAAADGCAVIEGTTFTASVAAAETTLAQPSVTTQSYDEASTATTEAMV